MATAGGSHLRTDQARLALGVYVASSAPKCALALFPFILQSMPRHILELDVSWATSMPRSMPPVHVPLVALM